MITAIEKEISLLGIWEILRLFVNTLTADDKYSLLKRDKLTQAIQMQLSKKKNTFSEIIFNFEQFLKKDDPQSLCISEIED